LWKEEAEEEKKKKTTGNKDKKWLDGNVMSATRKATPKISYIYNVGIIKIEPHALIQSKRQFLFVRD
jgi:hypothetical protein